MKYIIAMSAIVLFTFAASATPNITSAEIREIINTNRLDHVTGQYICQWKIDESIHKVDNQAEVLNMDAYSVVVPNGSTKAEYFIPNDLRDEIDAGMQVFNYRAILKNNDSDNEINIIVTMLPAENRE
jgi:hypothetical protein